MSDCHDPRRCDAMYRALSDFLDGELPAEERAAVEEHLRLCPPCGVYLEQFRQVWLLTGRVRAEDLPADFDAVMAGVMRAWKASRNRGAPPSA